MRTYTNMTWPDDPYRTGQQLYRRPAPLLAAFATGTTARGSRCVPPAIATVYLPLHHTRAIAVTEHMLTFGFHAASIDDPAAAQALAAVAGRDLLQARRHAAILAGHLLDRDLTVLQSAAGAAGLRGLAAVAQDWAGRSKPAPGRAAMFDSGRDLPGRPPLARACHHAGIAVGLGCGEDEADQPALGEMAAAVSVERALAIALLCARHLRRYTCAAPLHTRRIVAGAAWDCFPHLDTGAAAALPFPATAGRMAPGAARVHRSPA